MKAKLPPTSAVITPNYKWNMVAISPGSEKEHLKDELEGAVRDFRDSIATLTTSHMCLRGDSRR
jgi:hypothetical protein